MVARFTKDGDVADPAALAGWIWSHQFTARERRDIVAEEGGSAEASVTKKKRKRKGKPMPGWLKAYLKNHGKFPPAGYKPRKGSHGKKRSKSHAHKKSHRSKRSGRQSHAKRRRSSRRSISFG